jgi:DNA invertase Pin-like site-specific DNA recombinase
MLRVRRAVIYARVSGHKQTLGNESIELRRVADRRGWEIVEFYADEGISGPKGKDKRPAFDRLCKDATQGRFDIVMSWSVDRLCASLQELFVFLGDLYAANVDLYLDRQAVDTGTPAGRALFETMGVFANLERAMKVARINAGLDRARAKGRRSGPRSLPPVTISKVRDALANGATIRQAADIGGVGVATAHKIKVGLAVTAE